MKTALLALPLAACTFQADIDAPVEACLNFEIPDQDSEAIQTMQKATRLFIEQSECVDLDRGIREIFGDETSLEYPDASIHLIREEIGEFVSLTIELDVHGAYRMNLDTICQKE